MSCIIHDIEQGTDEWHALRCGKFTATKIAKLFMGKSTKGYNDIISRVAYERLTGKTPDSYSNSSMERGIELEPEAIRAYELETFNRVKRVGFVELSRDVGCSPDGLINEHGMIQVKCPLYNTLINYHVSGVIDKDYIIQMQAEMYVTGRQWNIFYAWHPDLRPFQKKILRDPDMIKQIKAEIDLALVAVNERIKLLGGTP